MEARFERTLAKRDDLLKGECHLIEKWECEFQQHLKQNEEMRAFLEMNPLTVKKPMDPRDAFYGRKKEKNGEEKISIYVFTTRILSGKSIR
ncbi:hypothetical protein J437_LFUL013346 [Ladona fulva]|uniref:Uncharacterized protein n=1 Tax=Ladona fulva TaxID=123851 RepID=A0A8K0KEB7_LADFU|nr:hypothetical protein J437_LFUL013346 [Ladona fulva]